MLILLDWARFHPWVRPPYGQPTLLENPWGRDSTARYRFRLLDSIEIQQGQTTRKDGGIREKV